MSFFARGESEEDEMKEGRGGLVACPF